MISCIKCAKSDTCIKTSGMVEILDIGCKYGEPKPLTHYDFLISKSPEEIAKVLNDIQYTSYVDGMFSSTTEKYPTTYSGWLNWLNAEANDMI